MCFFTEKLLNSKSLLHEASVKGKYAHVHDVHIRCACVCLFNRYLFAFVNRVLIDQSSYFSLFIRRSLFLTCGNKNTKHMLSICRWHRNQNFIAFRKMCHIFNSLKLSRFTLPILFGGFQFFSLFFIFFLLVLLLLVLPLVARWLQFSFWHKVSSTRVTLS